MATYIKTLKEDNGDIIYPQTKGSAVLLDGGSDLETVLAAKADASTVNQKITVGDVQSTDIVANAVTAAKLASNSVETAKIADDAVTSAKINWASAKADPDVGDGLGWVYLGQTRLTAAASSLTFTFPKKYDNYKIMFGGEFASGSGTWIDLRLLNGSTAIVGGHQVQDATGTGWAAAVNENVSYHLNSGNCYTYETVNIDFYSLKTATSQWRKFQGHLYKVGSSYTVRTSNGRLGSTTEPTAVQIITGGTLAAGAVIKVWASNNT